MSLRLPTKSIARMSAAVGLAAGLTVVLGACSFSIGTTKPKAARQTAEELIAGNLPAQGLGPLKPTCETPKDDQTDEGDSFACTATNAAGKTVTFKATFEGTKVHIIATNAISVERLRAFEKIAVGAIEDEVGRTLGAENFTCGDEVIVYEPNAPIACTLTDPETGREAPATMRLDSLSDDAHLRVKVGR
jgi:hypothetical protein